MTRGDALQAGGAAVNMLVARQPIFGRDMSMFGYELLFRQCDDATCTDEMDFNRATLLMIADGYSLAASGIDPRKKVCLNVTRDALLCEHILALPPERVVLEIPTDDLAADDLLDKYQTLKSLGFQLTIDNYRPEQGGERLLALADYVKVAIPDYSGKEVAALRQRLKPFPCRLIASRIENWEMFSGCKFLGFDLFQGFFFARAEVVPGRKISANNAVRLRLLRELSGEEADLKRVVSVLGMDMALSVRLLKFINSSAMRLAEKVDSIGRAVALMGLGPLRRWTMAALLADSDLSDRGQELAQLCLHRAFFLASLADAGHVPGADRDALFLLGLLSLADSLFGIPMPELLKDLPLEPYMRAALLKEEDQPFTDFIRLLEYIEQSDWDAAGVLLRHNRIPALSAATLYMQTAREAAEALAP